MPVSQRRGPYAKTQARRAEIARAALDVVTTDGHKAVTVASVAARSGLSEATVAYHFATRDHLLVAAVELSNEVMAEGADIDLLAGVSRTGEFLSLMAAVGTSSRNRLALFEAMAAEAADPDHPAHAWLNRHYGTLLTVLAARLQELQHDGQAHPDLDPMRFARQMVAVWDGLQRQWLADPAFDLPDEVASAFRLLSRADILEARRAMEALAADL